jgi:predicted ribosomally synthesized peptide with nif11-like leader
MSKQSAKEFMERLEKDKNLRSELMGARTDKERQKIIERNDFQFTEQEFQAAYREKYQTPVNEDELRRVVGGTAREGKQVSKGLSKMNPEVAKVYVVGGLIQLEE